MSLKEAALAYALKGWPVFPCRRDKAPLVKGGFHEATTNPEQIETWWSEFPQANIGFSPGHAGLMVVDLDPGHDPAFARSLPETNMVQVTPRGGSHLFYALGAGETCKSPQSKVSDHVDIRSAGAYVLLAPSATADGPYKWEREGGAGYRSDDLLRQANSAREKNPDRDIWLIKPDLPENIERAVKWLVADAAPAVEGQGGDARTVGAASMLRSLGVSEDRALDLMLEYYNPRCDPPWDDEGLTLKVRNGYAFANGQPGEMTPAFRTAKVADLFQVLEAEAKPETSPNQVGVFRAVDRDGMALIKPPEWLIDDCIPEGGYAIMFGPPGGLKTFVALDMALSVATGATFPWEGLWPKISKPGPVLFAAGEGRSGIVKRVEAWERKHWGGKRVSNFILVDPVPHVTGQIDDFLKLGLNMSPEGYALVVIDTVGRAMQGINENAQEHASKFTMYVSHIQKCFGCAVLALHHTGHSHGDRARGSIVFEADADTMIRIDREDKENLLELVMVKQKDAPEWVLPRVGYAHEITLPNGYKSLAVGQAPPEALEARKTASPGKGLQDDGVTLEIVEAAVKKVLGTTIGKDWTQKALAEAVAMDESIVNVPSGMLARNHLVRLRENADSAASKWYDPVKCRWRIK